MANFMIFAFAVLAQLTVGTACFIEGLFPQLGPVQGGTLVTISLQGEWPENAQIDVGGIAYASGMLGEQVGQGEVRFEMPAAAQPGDVTISSPQCAGSQTQFQYYDFSAATIVPKTTTIRGSGGSSITLDISDIALRDWNHASLELTTGCKGEGVTFQGLARSPGSLFFRTDNTVNSVLCAPEVATARLALNGQDFEPLDGITFSIVESLPYKVLFVYVSSPNDFGWTYAQNIARMAVAEQFTISVETLYAENVPVVNEPALRAVVESYKFVDMIVLTSEGYIGPLSAIAPDYPDVQFVITSGNAMTHAPDTHNVNYVWATHYEARYLAGVIAGGMLSPQGKLCYIKAFDSPEVTRGMNAYFLGAKVLRPTAQLTAITINAFYHPFFEIQAAQALLDDCEIIAQQTDTSEPQLVFVQNGKFCVGSNSDTRVFLGESVLASPLLNWNNPYLDMVQDALDGVVGNKSVAYQHFQRAVAVSGISGHVPVQVRTRMEQEASELDKRTTEQYIFCGPIHDSQGTLRFAAGECATPDDLASMVWEVDGITNVGYLVPNYPDNDSHYLSYELRAVVYAVFAVLVLFGFFCLYWVMKNRMTKVIRYAQPFFLYLVLAGCVIGLLTIIPLSIDHSIVDVDLHDPDLESKRFLALDIACESQLWLLFTGFSLAVPALFVKTWRVARIFEAGKTLKRIRIAIKDCAIAIGCCLAFVWTVLGLRFVKGPRYYKFSIDARDEYGNPTSTYGSCEDNAGIYWLLPNWTFVVLALAYGNYLGFKCRRNETINSESKWITLCLMNILQTCIIALPIVVYEYNNPALRFGVQSFAVVVAFGGTIAMIFVPKLLLSPAQMETQEATTSKGPSARSYGDHTTSSNKLESSGEVGIELQPRTSAPV